MTPDPSKAPLPASAEAQAEAQLALNSTRGAPSALTSEPEKYPDVSLDLVELQARLDKGMKLMGSRQMVEALLTQNSISFTPGGKLIPVLQRIFPRNHCRLSGPGEYEVRGLAVRK
jgi:hypothetical protein